MFFVSEKIDSIKELFTSIVTSEQVETLLKQKDLDPTVKTAVIDNAANAHIWTVKDDFINGTLRYLNQTNATVTTIGGSDFVPKVIGDVKTSWLDDEGVEHTMVLKECLYFPDSPVNVISVTGLAS